ncbi:MAG: hypothetical protein QXG03_00560 [Halalkalicoccus sp.]
MEEPSDTTPDRGEKTTREICEQCGEVLGPMEWTTVEDEPGYESALHFCDEGCLEAWRASQ